MHTIKPEKAEEIEDFKKLDALGKKHDIDPIKIALASGEVGFCIFAVNKCCSIP